MAWLSGWAKRIKITVDADQVDAALSNFPVPIYLSAASGISDDDVSCVFDELTSDANRKKIAVTTDDGTTQCYVEIERWDDASEKAWLHVKLPSVSESADTDLYLYYDSSQEDNTTYVGDTTDAAAQSVWDSDFVGVYHMEQDPSGGASAIKDSTNNGRHLTPYGSMTTSDLVDGQFGKAIDFDGSNDYMEVASNLSAGYTSVTCEALAKATVWTSPNGTTIIRFGAGSTGQGTGIAQNGSTGRYNNGVYGDDASTFTILNEWRYLVQRVGSGNAYFFENDQPSSVNTVSFTSGEGKLALGKNFSGSAFFGFIGAEIRISQIARSNAWLKTTYHGLFDSLLEFGAEEIGTTVLRLSTAILRVAAKATVPFRWIMSGTVKEGGSPVERTVRLYARSTGAMADETTSAAVDGAYSFDDCPPEPCYVVALDDDAGDDFNAMILDRVIPVQDIS
jgi:hypothetical protein